MSSDYVFTMYRVDKFYGSDRQVLANISLVVPARREDRRARPERRRQVDAAADHGRPRGAVVAAIAELAPGATVGFLEQEPELDPAKDVRGNVEDGVRELRDLLDRFNAISRRVRRARRRLRRAARRAGRRCRSRSTATTPGRSTRRSTARWTRCACPEGDRDVDDALGRRAPPRRALPAAALLARPAAARRADEPPRRRVGRLARALPRRVQGHGRSPSPTIATSSTTSPAGSSSSTAARASRSRGTTRRGSSRSRRGSRSRRRQESARRRTLAARARVGPHEPEGAARQVEGAPRAPTRSCSPRTQNVKLDRVEIHIPAGPRLGDVVVEAERRREGLRRPAARRGPDVLAAARRHRRRDRAERRRQDDALPHDRRRGAARRRRARASATRSQLAYVDQSRGDLDPKNTVWKEISGGHDVIVLGKREVNSRQYSSWFNFRGGDQQKQVGDLSGGERNRVHLAKLLKSGGNVLLLDEPTNDLDVDTLRALEDALLDFAGCAVVITPRPLVPRPHRDAHPGLRGRLAGDVVRGHLGRVRRLGHRDARRPRRSSPTGSSTSRSFAPDPAASGGPHDLLRCELQGGALSQAAAPELEGGREHPAGLGEEERSGKKRLARARASIPKARAAFVAGLRERVSIASSRSSAPKRRPAIFATARALPPTANATSGTEGSCAGALPGRRPSRR